MNEDLKEIILMIFGTFIFFFLFGFGLICSLSILEFAYHRGGVTLVFIFSVIGSLLLILYTQYIIHKIKEEAK